MCHDRSIRRKSANVTYPVDLVSSSPSMRNDSSKVKRLVDRISQKSVVSPSPCPSTMSKKADNRWSETQVASLGDDDDPDVLEKRQPSEPCEQRTKNIETTSIISSPLERSTSLSRTNDSLVRQVEQKTIGIAADAPSLAAVVLGDPGQADFASQPTGAVQTIDCNDRAIETDGTPEFTSQPGVRSLSTSPSDPNTSQASLISSVTSIHEQLQRYRSDRVERTSN